MRLRTAQPYNSRPPPKTYPLPHARNAARRPRGTPSPRAHGRSAIRRVQSRPLCDRRVDLSNRAARRRRAAHGRRGRPRSRAGRRGRRADPAARRRHVAVRPDRRRGARHRPEQAREPAARGRYRECERLGRARNRARRPERASEAARPLVSGRRLDVGASHDRRHDGEQQLRRTLLALRQHGAQRARGRDVALERRNPHVRSRRRASAVRPCPLSRARHHDSRAARARARRNRSARAEAAAPRRRLQPRPRVGGHIQRRSAARRLGRNARAVPQDQAQARAAARAQSARRRALPDVLSGDGPDSAHRGTRAHGRRARRSHDDRAVARHRGVPRDDGQNDSRRARRDPARRVRGRRAGP